MADNVIKKAAEKICEMIYNKDQRKPEPYDTTAEVRRVENGKAYVHIPGGIDETPVDLTIDAAAGDTVQVRVADGSAWLVGNRTAPPTDDTTARRAQSTATKAQDTADAAEEEAGTAKVEAAEARQTAGTAETKADTALSQVGASITTDTLHYLATDQSSGVTINTPGWTTTVQAITTAAPYLWTYHTYHKASGQSVNTDPVITGVYGETGPQGQQGQQGPAGPQGQTGPAGSDGSDGVSITAVQPQYALSTSTTTAPTTGWSTSLTYETGKYIWTRDKITYSNSTTGYSTAIYNQALTEACSTSEQALNVAEGIDEHFWYDNTGAHVTEDTQEAYQQDPANAGGNALMTSQGMAVRKGTKELATMSQNGFDAKTYDSSDNEVVIAHLGYGSGADSGGGTSNAPYYDLGVRKSGTTKGNYSIAEGNNTTASRYASHAEGWKTIASGNYSHAEGEESVASSMSSHAEGFRTTASQADSHSEGYGTIASGSSAHAEGYSSTASEMAAHSEGYRTTASGSSAHAEGEGSVASGNSAHAEGYETIASDFTSHAEGNATTASGRYSHSQNFGTVAQRKSQTVFGEYNILDTGGTDEDTRGDYAFIIGNGTSNNARSNAFEVTWTGDTKAYGDITALGKATLGAINGDTLFDYSTVSMTSSSISANASGEVTSSASNKANYYPIAITNVNISTGQASLRRFYFSTQQSGKAVVKIGLQNDGTSAKTISVSADILWVKIAV